MSKLTLFLKNNKKGIIAISISVIVLVIVLAIVKAIRSKTVAGQKEQAEQIGGASVSSDLNFDDMAKRLLKAFYQNFGTNEDEVYTVLGLLKNRSDWEYLKTAYNVQWKAEGGVSIFVHTVFSWLSGNLITDLKSEMNNKELQQCRDILIAKGITPDF